MSDQAWFDINYYLQQKANELNSTGAGGHTDWTAESVQTAFSAAGLSAYQHYQLYGANEGINPNQYFDQAYYLSAKAAELNAAAGNTTTWTPALVLAAIENAGLTPYEHFSEYGVNEGLNPSENFDVQAYLQEKATELNQSGDTTTWTPSTVLAALESAGLDPITHFIEYGSNEGLTAPSVSGGTDSGGGTSGGSSGGNDGGSGDTTPPNAAFSAFDETVQALSSEAGELVLYKNTTILANSTFHSSNSWTSIDITAQPTITNAVLKVIDESGNASTSTENLIIGTSSSDTITSNTANQFIFGCGGDDNISISSINGTGSIFGLDHYGTLNISGGSGNDTISVGNETDEVTTGIVYIWGGEGNDTIKVNSGINSAASNPATEVFFLSGGDGNDTFEFNLVANAEKTTDQSVTYYISGGDGKSFYNFKTDISGTDYFYGKVRAFLINFAAGDLTNSSEITHATNYATDKDTAVKFLNAAGVTDGSLTANDISLKTITVNGTDHSVIFYNGNAFVCVDNNTIGDDSHTPASYLVPDGIFGDGDAIIELEGVSDTVDNLTALTNFFSGPTLTTSTNNNDLEFGGTAFGDISMTVDSAAGSATITRLDATKTITSTDFNPTTTSFNLNTTDSLSIGTKNDEALILGTINTSTNTGSGGINAMNTIITGSTTTANSIYVKASGSASITGGSAADIFMLVATNAADTTSTFDVRGNGGNDMFYIDYTKELSGSSKVTIEDFNDGDTTNISTLTVENFETTVAGKTAAAAFLTAAGVTGATSSNISLVSFAGGSTTAIVYNNTTYLAIGTYTSGLQDTGDSSFGNGEMLLTINSSSGGLTTAKLNSAFGYVAP